MKHPGYLALVLLALLSPCAGFAQVNIGDAPTKPKNIPIRPRAPSPDDLTVTGGFTVNTASREQVRDFYNGIFSASENIPINSTADVDNCFPGENSQQFIQAVALRINWYRAMAGLPAAVTLDPIYSTGSQQVAVMISANHILNHNPPTNYDCYNTNMAHFAGGNQAEGVNGADAVEAYINDYGTNNFEVGHRRWLLFPQTLVMGTGDVPSSDDGTNAAANSIWVFDSSINDPRPATRQPFVSWPPAGFVPYQVTYPRWSFALSNADLSLATVTMTSNGVPINVTTNLYETGYGENTIVFLPQGSVDGGTFPFNGADTVYGVTVTNIGIVSENTTNYIAMSYSVTVFDPAVPGADYIPPVISGPAPAIVNAANVYSTVPINNPNTTSYDWITGQLQPGNVMDNANNGLANFTVSPPTDYPVITNAYAGGGNCFHLTHDDAMSHFLQFNEIVLAANNTTLSFQTFIGYSTSDESARVQASTNNGATWDDLYVEVGCNTGNVCDSVFTPQTISLSNYAGLTTLLRFNYAFTGGSYYPQSDNDVGWSIENIVLTNAQQLVNLVTNVVASTNISSGSLLDDGNNGLVNFTFTPSADYLVITNAPDGSDTNCFHLCDDNATTQILQLNETLLPSTNAQLSFGSDLGYSTSDESAHVQVSTNAGAAWQDLYEQTGCDDQCETSFTPHTISLGSFAGQPTLLRFEYAFNGGSYYPGQSAPYVGWCLENIAVTNTQQIATTPINTTNFTFIPTQPGNYFLQVVPFIFGEFPLDPGPKTFVTAVSVSTIVLATPMRAGNQVQLNFSVSGGLTGNFQLLQTSQLGAAWATNTVAMLTTNVAGSSYRFTTTNGSAAEFYRVKFAQ
jgi:hypothetical protein